MAQHARRAARTQTPRVAVRDLLGEVRGDHNDAFGIADDNVSRVNPNTATSDRNIDVDGVMVNQVGRRGRCAAIHRNVHSAQVRHIPESAVGHDPCRPRLNNAVDRVAQLTCVSFTRARGGKGPDFHVGSFRWIVEVHVLVSKAHACDVVEHEHSAALDPPRHNLADGNRMSFAQTCEHRLSA